MGFFLLLGASSCKKKSGCMDFSATNYNSEAVKDCGCCSYAKVVFYSRYQAYNVGGVWYSINAFPIRISVNGQEIGTVEAFYPNGPGSTTVPGVITYDPGNNKNVEWFAKVTAPDGQYIVLGSGTFTAGRSPVAVPIF